MMISVEIFGIQVPVEWSKAFLGLYYLNFAFPALAVFGLFYTGDLKRSELYSLGITMSVLFRTLFFIAEIYGYNDKKFLLVLCFFIMSVYMISEKLIKRKIKSIETNLL